MPPNKLGQYHMTDITLTKKQYEYALEVGRSRNASNEAAERVDMKADPDGVGIHEQGAIGEVAVCVFAKESYTQVKDEKPDQGPDVVTTFGTVAVKCRDARKGYVGGYLKSMHLDKECSADWACLTWIVDKRTVRIVGFLRKAEFDKLVKRASEYNVRMPRDGWYVPWYRFCMSS